ncbi:hypothetical protein DM860_013200 [Cuscuta australis]|uniref:LOB domain-containing protein n=1 Tax=Cuscuta australis TaxID=267555 RepID=A0A328DNH9_9ASTE|nr:hypothetical protein DM860_013200 [Cuscuta australis]
MSCNGCRVLRRRCGVDCILRPCLDELDNPQAQANATLFVSKFFGRADLFSFISSVPLHRRPALFRSLLYEACGRTVNPVSGAVGLLSTGNWHVCVRAVETVLSGGDLRQISPDFLTPSRRFQKGGAWGSSEQSAVTRSRQTATIDGGAQRGCTERTWTPEVCGSRESGCRIARDVGGGEEPKLLNLFL